MNECAYCARMDYADTHGNCKGCGAPHYNGVTSDEQMVRLDVLFGLSVMYPEYSVSTEWVSA